MGGAFTSTPGPKGYGDMTPPGTPTGSPRLHPAALQKAHADCTKPLNLTMPLHYGARHGHEGGMQVRRRNQGKSHVFFERWRINGPILFKAIICLLVPPLIFLYTTTFLSFYTHFVYPKRVWPIALLGAIPVIFSAYSSFRSWKAGLDTRWAISSTVLFAIAFGLGILLGDVNYLMNMHHFYFVNSLKSYSNIKPGEVTGTQLMDAGRVQFAEGTKLKVNMGMSFTMWDTYCVAPIAGSGGNGGNTLASYDIWAVGKNCCSSSNPEFACGQYNNPKARSGLRQTNEDERLYFNLAVQQAEAAYGITADHPIFFHWVEDADMTMQSYFTKGFRSWVFMIFCHMCVNAFVVVMLMNAFKYSNRALFHEDRLPGHYMLHADPHGHGGHGHH